MNDIRDAGDAPATRSLGGYSEPSDKSMSIIFLPCHGSAVRVRGGGIGSARE